MNHIDDDRLLEYALKTRNDPDFTGEIERHISECESCRAALVRIQNELVFLASVEFKDEIPPCEIPRSSSIWTGVLKAATLIVLGLVGGYVMASLDRSDGPVVLPPSSSFSALATAAGGMAVSEATSVNLRDLKTFSGR